MLYVSVNQGHKNSTAGFHVQLVRSIEIIQFTYKITV